MVRRAAPFREWNRAIYTVETPCANPILVHALHFPVSLPRNLNLPR